MGNEEDPRDEAGGTALSALGSTTLTCPICETSVSHTCVKSRLYAEKDKDIDFYPRSVGWLKGDYGRLQPRLYYICHCPQCLFAAGGEIFENPVASSSLPLTRFRKLYNSSCVNNPQILKIMQVLTKGVAPAALDFYQAVRLHLLAILQLQKIEPIATKDATDLARYCLRLAWLYRDIGLDADLRKQFGEPVAKLLNSLQKVWPEAPVGQNKALLMARDYYQVSLENSYKVDNAVSEINLLYLIARINLKLGNLKEGQSIIGLGKEKTRNFEAEVREHMRLQAQRESAKNSQAGPTQPQESPPKTDDEIAAMAQASRKLKNQAEEMQLLYEECRDRWRKTQLAACEKISHANPDAAPEQLRAMLLAQNIDAAIVEKFCPPAAGNEKKGLFGFFKRQPK